MAAAAEVVSDNGGGNLTRKEHEKLLICFKFCCFGGTIIGHDIVTSGDLTMSPFLKDVDDFSLTAFTSSLYVVALLTYYLLQRRKIPLILGWIIVIAGIVTSNFAQQLWMLIAGRILYGIGVGFSVKSMQVYAAPCLFHRHPVKLKLAVHLCIAMGIIMTHYAEYKTKPWWSPTAGFALFSMASHIKLILSPEEEDQEPRVIEYADSSTRAAADGELAVPLLTMKEHEHQPWGRPSYYLYLVAALAVLLLMQKLTGVNLVLMFYAPVLFYTIVFGSNAYLLGSVVVSVAIELFWHRTDF
ncbi:Sugar transport protein 12 [Linum grandiflorum]